jgi:hypothetical protein
MNSSLTVMPQPHHRYKQQSTLLCMLNYTALIVQQAAALPDLLLSLAVAVPGNPAGAESMIVRLALAAHSKQVGIALDRSLALGEAAFKQHIALQVRLLPRYVILGTELCRRVCFCVHTAVPAISVVCGCHDGQARGGSLAMLLLPLVCLSCVLRASLGHVIKHVGGCGILTAVPVMPP